MVSFQTKVGTVLEGQGEETPHRATGPASGSQNCMLGGSLESPQQRGHSPWLLSAEPPLGGARCGGEQPGPPAAFVWVRGAGRGWGDVGSRETSPSFPLQWE